MALFHVQGGRRTGGAAGTRLKPFPDSRADKRRQVQSTQPEQRRLNMGSHCHHLSCETAGNLPKHLIYHGKGGNETDCINTPRGLLLFPFPLPPRRALLLASLPCRTEHCRKARIRVKHPKNDSQELFQESQIQVAILGRAVATHILQSPFCPPASCPCHSSSQRCRTGCSCALNRRENTILFQ